MKTKIGHSNCMDLMHHLHAHHNGKKQLHSDQNKGEEIYQTSMMSALLEGVYSGEVTYRALSNHGNFGVGTFNDLDGEMVALDGVFYQIKSDGTVNKVRPEQRTPFAAVIFFKPEFEKKIEKPTTRKDLEGLLLKLAPTQNLFYAVRLDGLFKFVTTRVMPKQIKPYKPFVDATKDEPMFHYENCEGTLVGFRSPDYSQGMSVAGYHLHFITKDRTGGGHMIDFLLEQGVLTLDHSSNLHVELPETSAFMKADLNKPGNNIAIRKTE